MISIILFIMKYLIITSIFMWIIWAWTFLGIWYVRDVVRQFNTETIKKWMIIYKADISINPRWLFPDSLDILYEKNMITRKLEDPWTSYDFKNLNKLAKSVWIPESISDPNVNPENWYKFIYVTNNNKKQYETSIKYESVFFAKKMKQDWGNDPNRYEFWTDLSLDTHF